MGPSGPRSPLLQSEVRRHILPELLDFAPDLLLISAGFDGHERDRLKVNKCAAGFYSVHPVADSL